MITLSETEGFYREFCRLIEDHDELDEETTRNMRRSDYRKLLADNANLDLVKELAKYLKPALRKPQQPLILADNYYSAIDMATNTYYICFRRLLMVDIDNYKLSNFSLGSLPHTAEGLEGNLRYRVYTSRNGYHAFLISHEVDHQSDVAISLALAAGSDLFYVVYSHLRGCSVRLNRKPRETLPIYSYFGDIVQGHTVKADELLDTAPVNAVLSSYVDLHVKLSEAFADCEPCVTNNIQ